MERSLERRLSPAFAVRVALALFVIAWLLGPAWLQSRVPLMLVFLLALALEVNFFVSARRARPQERPDGTPQALDRESYGYSADADELVLVRDGDEELWIPYAGESEEELEELVAQERERREEETAGLVASVAEQRHRRRALRRFLASVSVIAALAAGVWAIERRDGWSGLDVQARSEATALFSAEASRIAGKEVAVACDERGEHVGVVQHADGAAIVGGTLAYLSPERCFDLYRLSFRGEVRSSQTGRAVAVLAHEAWHLRGVRDEGTTECYALQSGVELGRRLGLSEEEARQLMRQRLAENVLHRRGSPDYLLPAECRAGGGLDLSPGSDHFP